MKILIVCTTDSMIWNFLIPHIRHLESKGYLVECACAETGSFFNELINLGIILHKMPFDRSPYSLKNILGLNRLNSLVKNNGYDLIFCHEPVGGALGRIVGARNKVKVAYMAHGFHFFNGAPKINKILYYNIEKILAHKTDLIITINEEDYEAAKKFKCNKVAKINGIGININKFTYNPNTYLKDRYDLRDAIVLLSVGELITRKNHEAVIKAISLLPNYNIHYFIAGEGELLKHLCALTKSLGLEQRIHFMGFCKDINKLCNSCDIFVMPSLQEGLSLALMEAMASGKPIVASKIRGNVDLIENGKGGIFVSPKDPQEYANAIKHLILNPQLCVDMGAFNHDSIKVYDIELIKNKITKLLEAI